MSLAILFHFLCTQHVSDINISIIRSFSLQHGHYSNPAAPNLQHTTNRDMYNLKYFNNTLNSQSTNETYYTQENTMITKHKR